MSTLENNNLDFQNTLIHEDERQCFFYQAKYKNKRIFKEFSKNFKNFLSDDFPNINLGPDHSLDDYIHEKDRKIFNNTFANVKTQKHFNLEYSIYIHDTVKHVKERGSVKMIEGELIITSMIFDVSTDHQAYESLKYEHKKFKRIFESIQDGYIVLNLDGTVIESNNNTVSLLGYNNHEELIEANFFEDIIADRRQQEQFKKVIETSHEVYEIELELKKANGSPVYTLCSLHYIYGDFLKPLSIEGFIRDISLQKLQEIRKNLIANGDNLLTNISAQFINKGFNDAIEFGLNNLGKFLDVGFLSYARLDLEAKQIEVLYEWQNYQGISAGQSQFIQTSFEKNPLISEAVLKGKDYFLTDLDHHISNPAIRMLQKANCKSIAMIPAKSEDAVTGVLIATYSNPYHLFSGEESRILRTFCEYATNSLSRSETRQELIRSQESLKVAKELAESSTKTKSQFLANMSHEIRTPINGIIGFTELLLTSNLDSKQKLFLEKIGESSKSLLTIINDILDLSKIEADKLELQYVEFSLHDDVLNPINDLLAHLIQSKTLYLFIIVDKHCPDHFIGDPHRLKQIFLNLVGNAIKFTNKGGISVYVSYSKDEKDTPQLRAEVVDTGIGIAQENILKLFKSFSQADNSITRNYGGTGLGLKITKQLLLLMNGNVFVDSVLGEGTCFKFYCELLENSALNIELPYSNNQIKIALIGDFKDFQSQLERQFLQLGLTPVFSLNVQQISDEICDIIFVLDQKSPELNQRILDDIHFLESLSNLPLYLITDNEFFTKQAEQLSKCFDHVITFPIKQNHLFQKVMKHSMIDDSDEISVQKQNLLIPNLKQLKVLVIEDNRINQLLLQELLLKTNAEVFIADDGLQGTELILAKDPDFFNLVFMDLHMPNLDGISASKVIREYKTLQNIPIIAITANVMQGDKNLCLEAGMNDYVSKPIQAPQFYEVLTKWLKPKKYINQVVEQDSISSLNFDLKILDVKRALTSLCNNTTLYLKFVNNFYQDYHDVYLNILDLFTNKDFESFLRKIHTLKGLSGNLGAYQVQELLTNIEEYCQDKEYSQASSCLDALKHIFDLMLSDCLQLIQQQKTKQTSHPIIDPNDLYDKLLEINDLVKNYSFQAVLRYEKIHDSFSNTRYDQEANKLKELLTKFQFGLAEEIIVSLLQRVKDNQAT